MIFTVQPSFSYLSKSLKEGEKMLIKRTKRFCMVAFIAVIGLSMISSNAFAEGTGNGSKEGIKVHGHWKIEIFNPDGTLASVTEFENALISGQSVHLIRLLAGTSVHGSWGIQLENTTGTEPCNDAAGSTPDFCRIGESGGSYGSMHIQSTNLTVTENFASQPFLLTLSGSVTAANASTIDKVTTAPTYCTTNTQTPPECKANPNNIWGGFTATTLGAPPSVVPGQLIQVTVDISFS